MSDRTRIDRLVEGALACADRDRDAFLDAACAGNPALRQEIASLLAQASGAHSFLEEPAAAPSLVGRALGSYRIDARIGAGGMGEVYRARDTKLGRDVAIKILPFLVAQDPDLLSRLGREARALAALNHPHIGAIYGLEEADGVRGLVLELVDGETLAARIARGPLAIGEAVRIAGQIAEALAAAHAKGIVHRDLKPANVKITTTGSVKVLDFGLAKADGNESAGTTLATRVGTMMGTPAYMSPEQARGEAVDQQTDIWAFGCVLYEMLTARRAFDGRTASDSIAAVLKAEPDWPALPSKTPGAVRTLVARCLAKDRARRLHAIADARVDLDAALDRTAAAPVPRRPVWLTWSGVAAVVAVIGMAGYLYGRSGQVATPLATYGVELDLPDGFKPWAGVAISPEGKAIAASVGLNIGGDNQHLVLRYLDPPSGWQRLNGGEAAEYPFWSPDGRYLAFFTKDKLLRVDPPGGAPVVVCDAVSGRGGVWLEDGTIVFSTLSGPLMRVDANGGRPPTVFVPIEEGLQSIRHPVRAGPGRLLYLAQHVDDRLTELRSISLDAPQRPTAVMKTAKSGVYERGYLFYERNGSIIRQAFDPSTSQLHGQPVRVMTDGVSSGRLGYLPMDAAGGHLVVATVREPLRQLVWMTRDGVKLGDLGDPVDQLGPDLSPDGKRIAVARRSPDQSSRTIWVVDSRSGVGSPLADGANYYAPTWGPDGDRIAFAAGAPNSTSYARTLEGSPTLTPLVEQGSNAVPVGWTREGSFVWSSAGSTLDTDERRLGIFVSSGSGGSRETAVPFRTGFRVSAGRLSPDGRHIAYVSPKTGRAEVYVDTFPRPGQDAQISRNGGRSPRWSQNSRELYFLDGDDLTVASVSPDARTPIGAPKRMFSLPASSQYAANPDGSKFLVLEERSSPTSPLKLTLNWFASVARN